MEKGGRIVAKHRKVGTILGGEKNGLEKIATIAYGGGNSFNEKKGWSHKPEACVIKDTSGGRLWIKKRI